MLLKLVGVTTPHMYVLTLSRLLQSIEDTFAPPFLVTAVLFAVFLIEILFFQHSLSEAPHFDASTTANLPL